MFYMIPTKGGLGVELWGTYDDLEQFYDLLTSNYLDEEKNHFPNNENRVSLLSSFSYEIRKAYEGSRLKNDKSPISHIPATYLGCTFSWPHILFSLTAYKFTLVYSPTSKLEASYIQILEYWLENAMQRYDPVGALKLKSFINGSLYGGNPCIYQYMRSINLEFLSQGGGKRNFRKLPTILKRGQSGTDAYADYMEELEKFAKKVKTTPDLLEVDDEDFDYEGLKW